MEKSRYSRRDAAKKPTDAKIPYYALALITLGFLAVLIAALLSAFSSSRPLFGKCVAVVEIDGVLSTASASPTVFYEGSYGSYDIAKKIEALGSREDVGAVLLVVNSPGGSVVAADEIYGAVDSLEKPTVAYFRETAASGGYLIATPADYIISEPNALTGSIGVILELYDASGLMEIIGVRSTPITSGSMKDMGTPFRNMTAEEAALLGAAVNETFEQFVSTIREKRGDRLNPVLFNEALDGRVLTGRMAKKAGLVDELGSRDDALAKAASLAGIEYSSVSDIPLCEIPTKPKSAGLFDLSSFLGGLEGRGATEISLSYR
ncbi:MAG: signal peptide peptidase SppA [Candidatus Bilamarchaeaceae archaeon]